MNDETNCCNSPILERHFVVRMDASGVIALVNGLPELVEIDPPKPPSLVAVRLLTQGEVVTVAADCTTRPTGTGGRTACWSDWSVVSCPEGYAFDKEGTRVNREIEYGSENNVYVEWENYVRINPSLPFTAPRTVKLQVHARSGRDQGERGRTKVTLVAPYFRLT